MTLSLDNAKIQRQNFPGEKAKLESEGNPHIKQEKEGNRRMRYNGELKAR